MMIVLEGIDGVGKTTLANLLSKTLNAEVVHATRGTPNDWHWFSGLLDKARFRNIIMDRAFWGQFVYQEPEERHLTQKQLQALEHRLNAEHGKLVFVTATVEDIQARLGARAETLALPLEVLQARYAALVREARCPVITYNTSTGEVK